MPRPLFLCNPLPRIDSPAATAARRVSPGPSRGAFLLALAAPFLLATATHSREAPEVAVSGPTLQQIMADPIWIGKTPRSPYWSIDGTRIYFEQDREGEDDRDLFYLGLDDGSSADGEPAPARGDSTVLPEPVLVEGAA